MLLQRAEKIRGAPRGLAEVVEDARRCEDKAHE